MRGKRVLVRADFNVPVEDGQVVDDYRIVKSFPTINFLREKGAKVLLISHIELGEMKKKDASAAKPSLLPVSEYLSKLFPVTFAKDFFSDETKGIVEKMSDGDVVLFENLRNEPGETANDPVFAEKLASLGNVYVNDGFAVSHRSHASIIGVPKYIPGYAGLLLEAEIENLTSIFHPPHPFLFILGGAKFDTKLPLIQKFLTLAEHVFVGGALANNFFKEKKLEIGTSLFSEGNFDIKDLLSDQRLVIPSDVTVRSAARPLEKIVKKPEEVLADESILDAGPQTVADLKVLVSQAKCVLWNGPLGNYEGGFTEPTTELAKIMAESTAKTVVGGGDTLAAIASSGVEDKISFISTGGGAMLQFLLDETLPGIEALKRK